jgi:hypothetical protein
MDFAKYLGVGEKCAEAGIRAKMYGLSAVLGGGEILRVGIAEDASAQGGEGFGLCPLFAH